MYLPSFEYISFLIKTIFNTLSYCFESIEFYIIQFRLVFII